MSFNPYSEDYHCLVTSLWGIAKLTRPIASDEDAKMVLKFRSLYEVVERATGVPWWIVGGIDMREESFRHNANLCNGDPLDKPTTHVPKGVGPFPTWMDGAIFAMKFSGLKANDFIGWLIQAEIYNGLGYHHHLDPAHPTLPEPSPYIWSGTDIYTSGKYVADGKWNPNAVDQQTGIAAMLKSLIGLGIVLT